MQQHLLLHRFKCVRYEETLKSEPVLFYGRGDDVKVSGESCDLKAHFTEPLSSTALTDDETSDCPLSLSPNFSSFTSSSLIWDLTDKNF